MKEGRKNKISKISIFVFGILLVSSFVLATLTGVTLNTPATGENISGNYTFNATIAGTGADNVTFYHNESGSWVEFCVNATAGTEFICINDTSSLPDGTYYFNATAQNDTDLVSIVSADVIVDNTVPTITIASPTAGWKMGNITIYENSTDATTNISNSTIYFWFGNSTGNYSITLFETCPYVNASTGFNCSVSFNTTLLSDGNYTLWVNASDTMASPNSDNESLEDIGVDNTKPSVLLSLSSQDKTSIVVSSSCTDSGSGVASCALSSSSGTASGSTISGLVCGTAYTITVSSTDNVGNTHSTSASMSTTGCGTGSSSSSTSSSTSGNATTTSAKTHTFTSLSSAGNYSIGNFNLNAGLKGIDIAILNNKTYQDVKFTIESYDSKPSNLSLAKAGKVYNYIQIETTNLDKNFGKAIFTLNVNKSWVSSNSLDKEKISLFWFDENSNKWESLSTAFSNEDENFYYYTAETTHFSYFSIGSLESSVGENGEDPEEEVTATNPQGIQNGIPWILILVIAGVIIAVGLAWYFLSKKK